jgi:hypothetical protein
MFEHTSLAYYSYCQSIVRWKKLLLHHVPTAAELIDVLGMLHRLLLHRILSSFDGVKSSTEGFSTAAAMGFVLSEIPSLKLCESVNQAEVRHLHAGISYRCMFFISKVGVPDPVTKETHSTGSRGQASSSGRISGHYFEPSEYWPPNHCKNRRGGCGNSTGGEGCLDCPSPPTLDVQPTPLQFLEAKPTCFPSTMMYCLPSHVLAFLGIDMESLASDIHNPEGWIQRISHPLPGMLRHSDAPKTDQDALIYSVVQESIRKALSMSLKVYFDVNESEMRSGNWRGAMRYHDDRGMRELERAAESPLRV